MSRFPELPIITPGPDRKSQGEKYGSLYYLAIAGVVVLVGVIAFFAFGLWSMRSVWSDIYLVSDPKKSDLDRINAAWRLSRDSRVNDRQKWDLALSKTPPLLARYLLAETLSSEAPSSDPRGYALAVTRSQDLPESIRILLARPLAVAAAGGRPLDRKSLEEVCQNPNPFVAAWGVFAISVDEPPGKADADLTRLQADSGPGGKLAKKLAIAAAVPPPARQEGLQEATLWLRENEQNCKSVWRGYREDADGIKRVGD